MFSNTDVIARLRDHQKTTNDALQREIDDIWFPKTVTVPFNTESTQVYPGGAEVINGDDTGEVVLNTIVEYDSGSFNPVGTNFTLSQYYNGELLETPLAEAGLTLEAATYPDPRDTSGYTTRTISRYTQLQCNEERARYNVTMYAKFRIGGNTGTGNALDIKPRHYSDEGVKYWKRARYAASTTFRDTISGVFNSLESVHYDTSIVPIFFDCLVDGSSEFGTSLQVPRKHWMTINASNCVTDHGHTIDGGGMDDALGLYCEMTTCGHVELWSGEQLSAALVCPFNVRVEDGHISLTKCDKMVNHHHEDDPVD